MGQTIALCGLSIPAKDTPPPTKARPPRRRAGLKSGQELEFKVSGGVITILPKLPTADDDYTPDQRRVIDARLAEGLADIKAGRTFGPFDSAAEMIAHMEARATKRTTAKRATAKGTG